MVMDPVAPSDHEPALSFGRSFNAMRGCRHVLQPAFHDLVVRTRATPR